VPQFSSLEIRVPWDRLHDEKAVRVELAGDDGVDRLASSPGGAGKAIGEHVRRPCGS
jgi:hypothetical protein